MTDVSSKNDELGCIKPKVPAWKLRQQQRANYKPTSTTRNDNINNNNNNDELGGTKAIRQRNNNNALGVTRSSADINTSRRRSNEDELGSTSSPSIHTKSGVPAWRLREQMKQRDHNFNDKSTHSNSSTGSSSKGSLQGPNPASSNHSNHPSRSFRPVSRVPGAVDPLLPFAFRTALQKSQDRKKTGDDFLSGSSVHSRTTACSRTNSYGSDSFGSLDGSDSDGTDSFDGEDSFASLDSDADEDDEAYRESRNQMARLEIEKQKQVQDPRRGGIRGRTAESRFRKTSLGVHGTPLGFIAE